MVIKMKKAAMAVACAAALGGASSAHAANWLMLQGTEPDDAAPRAKVWGFVQPEFQSTDDTKVQAGPWKGASAQFNQIIPDLNTGETFQIRRARLGVRGTGFPLDNKVNYFFLSEFGNNGVTVPGGGGGSARLTDASVTLNHIKGARIRAGLFKTPGAEEGLAAIHVFDYINFTNFTFGQVLERYFEFDGTGTRVTPRPSGSVPPVSASDSGEANKPITGVGAFRDVGIQVFDTFKMADWEHSYAVMYGNGNGLHSDNDDNKDTYLYWSSEKVFGGKGPRREGWKIFAWNQDGKRTLTLEGGNSDPTDNVTGEFDRTRSGVGTTYRRGKYRAAFEYMTADGMIFNGTDGGAVAGTTSIAPGAAGPFGAGNGGGGDIDGDNFVTASFNMEPKGEADGAYVHFGYAPNPKWEFDIRYDVMNRMTDVSAKERKFETTTLGVQYFFNKKSRFVLNHELRSAEAPNLPASDNANKILDGVDDRTSAEILVIF